MTTPRHARPEPPRRYERETAQLLLSTGQSLWLVLGLVALVLGLALAPGQTLLVMVGASIVFYALFTGLKAVLAVASSRYRQEHWWPAELSDDLPVYSLLVPLYKEANMLPTLMRAIDSLHYPKHKLQVLLLLEEDDTETRHAAASANLPRYVETVVVPNVKPRGKPKAMNVGFEHVRGEFCVIYDAEDRPDPDQLLKAVGAFRSLPAQVACLQARLFFWNGDSSWVTRFYWGEYVVHFEWVLAGLAKLNLIPPLGGTSNHFRVAALAEVAMDTPDGNVGIWVWDGYNVTEDAELAGALALRGYQVQMIDSITREEATARLKVADHQRRRWLKGYLQTGLVYSRHPIKAARIMGPVRWACYILLMLGTPLSLLLNPIFWTMTITYLATRSEAIERLFPGPIFYLGVVMLVAGNLLTFYQMVAACLHRQGYGGVKYMFLIPFWWLFTSYSCYFMLCELVNPRTRHLWRKTPHGHDLAREQQIVHSTNAMA